MNISQYWDRRYALGGNSGAGSRGDELDAKVRLVQTLVDGLKLKSVLDLGCGDGFFASRIEVDEYVGYDVSSVAVNRCRTFVPRYEFLDRVPTRDFDLILSMDVIFHLVNDLDYHEYMKTLWRKTTNVALVYGTDRDERGRQHVLHRSWVKDIPPDFTAVEVRNTGFKRAWLVERNS